MAKDTLVNGRSPVTAVSGGVASGGPDVCKTPVPGGPPMPLPYPNQAETKDLIDCDRTVKINGADVMTSGSRMKRSRGDEPGTAKGVMSESVGGACEALTYSSDLKIGGQAVCRNGDMTYQNKRNAIARISQSEPSKSKAKKKTNEQSNSARNCDICSSTQHETPQIEESLSGAYQRGSGRRSIARRIRKRWSKRIGKPEKGRAWQGHPWCAGPRTIQVHHLIDCAALKKNPIWALCCPPFGYDVNHYNNGSAFPCVDGVACALMIPLHYGNHDFAFVYAANGSRIIKHIDSDDEKDRYLCYPEAVRDLIAKIGENAEAGLYCSSGDAFVREMDEKSAQILQKLVEFRWTLSPAGRNYKPGEVGCRLCKEAKTAEMNSDDYRLANHSQFIDQVRAMHLKHQPTIGY